jgi:hypothetical protein
MPRFDIQWFTQHQSLSHEPYSTRILATRQENKPLKFVQMQESELIFSFDATSYFLSSLAVRIVYNSNNVFPQRSKFGGYQKNARLFTLRVKGQKRSESSNPTIISPGTLLVCVHRSGCAYALVCFPLPQICSFDLCYLLSRWFLHPSAPMYAG